MLIRFAFIAAGVALVGLGVIGILLPGLPATPFLLLAAYCFARSSPRLHAWLVTHHWFGPYIRGARAGWRIPRRQAWQTIAALWVSLAISAWFLEPWWGRLLLLAVGVGVSLFLERRSRAPVVSGSES